MRIYQAVSSDETMQYAARERHVAVLWQMPRDRLAPTWRRYEQLVEEIHGVTLRPGEDRMLVVNVYIGDSTEAAIREARPGHDELRKLIWPNIVKRNPALAGRPAPSLEESMASGAWLVGTAEAVRDQLLEWQAELGLEDLTIFRTIPG